MKYQAAKTPLIILAGKEYGAGSSRDWAAKGTALLGVRAVIAESYERIHRSNLIGMGVVPLQFRDGESADKLGLTGSETFDIEGLAGVQRSREAKVTATSADGKKKQFTARRAHRHAEGAGLLHPRRHPAVRAAATRDRQAGRVSWFRRKPPDPAAIGAERAAARAKEQKETVDKLDPGGLSLAPDAAASNAAARRARNWRRGWSGVGGVVVLIALIGVWVLCYWWSREPEVFFVNDKTPDGRPVVGYSTADTLTRVLDWMLNKPGGYLSNDVAPPSVFLDNQPSFEFGVLVQVRDLTRTMRNDYSRSQSQSVEDRDLIVAEPALELHERPLADPVHRRQVPRSARRAQLVQGAADRRRPRRRPVLRARGQPRAVARLGRRTARQLVAALGRERWPNSPEHRPCRRTGGRLRAARRRRGGRQDAVARDRRRVLRSARDGLGVAAVLAGRSVRLRADARRQECGRVAAPDHSGARGGARADREPDDHEWAGVWDVCESFVGACVVSVASALSRDRLARAARKRLELRVSRHRFQPHGARPHTAAPVIRLHRRAARQQAGARLPPARNNRPVHADRVGQLAKSAPRTQLSEPIQHDRNFGAFVGSGSTGLTMRNRPSRAEMSYGRDDRYLGGLCKSKIFVWAPRRKLGTSSTATAMTSPTGSHIVELAAARRTP